MKVFHARLVFSLALAGLMHSIPVSAETRNPVSQKPSFVIAGSVFFDANGNGIHDNEEKTWIRSGGKVCKETTNVPNVKILISYPGFTKQYPVSTCNYKGSEGSYFVTDPIPTGTTITASVIAPRLWRTTWPDPVTHVIAGENYLNFALTKDAAMKSSLTVLLPNGGEKLKKGARYKIRWQASGVSRVNVLLYKGNECSKSVSGKQICGKVVALSPKPPTALALNVPNRGWLYWTVPETLEAGNDYRIAIQDPRALPYVDQSNRGFSVVD